MHLRYLIKPVCVQYGRLFSQKNAFRIQRSRAQERGLSRGNLSPLTRFWFGVPDGSQDPMGRGGRTAAGRAARSVTEGQLDSSGGCARRGGAKGCPRRVGVQIRLSQRLAPPKASRNDDEARFAGDGARDCDLPRKFSAERRTPAWQHFSPFAD